MDYNFANWSAWSIRQQALEGMLQTLSAPETYKLLSGNIEEPQARPYRVQNNIAIVPIEGPITKQASVFSFLFGGSTYPALTAMVQQAADDSKVKGIVLDVDSPGGTVSGVEALTEAVRDAASKKPVVAFANGSMCSAAYFFSSAAHFIVAERTAVVGSIGVICVHSDFSKADSQRGVTYTVMTAGKYKAVGNSYQPLSDDDKNVIQSELDSVYDVFLDTVATNRKASKEKVHSDMADGRVFIGQAALDAGLVDQVGFFDDALKAAIAMAEATSVAAKEPTPSSVSKGSVSQIIGLVKAVYGASEAEKISNMVALGVNDPDRVINIISAVYGTKKGQYLADLAKNGVTAEKLKAAVGDKALQNIRGKSDKREKNIMPNQKGFMELVEEYQWHYRCSKLEALKAVMKKHPDAHRRYIEEANPHISKDEPEASDQDGTGTKTAKGFMELVNDYRTGNNCSLDDAQAVIKKSHPEAHKRYLQKFN